MANEQKSEKYFWEVCGTISFIIIAITAAIAFRRQVFVRFHEMHPGDYIKEM